MFFTHTHTHTHTYTYTGEVGVAVAVTLFLTLLVTAAITALLVFLIMKFLCQKSSNGDHVGMKYDRGSYDAKHEAEAVKPVNLGGTQPAPHSASPRKPPPRPPNRPVYT